MSNRLKELGCVKNKSLKINFDQNIIPQQYMNAFIRGYFDGDGCVWQGKRKYMQVNDFSRASGKRIRIINNVKFTITGNVQFISSLQDYLISELKLRKTKLNFSKAKIKKHICTMEYSGRLQLKKFYDYIYKDAEVYCEQKRNKFKKIFCAFTEKSVIETTLIEETPEMVIVSQAA